MNKILCLLLMVIGCNSKQNNVDNFIKIIKEKDFQAWIGFPMHFSVKGLSVVHKDKVYTGMPGVEVDRLFFNVEGYDAYPELYILDNVPLKTVIDFPELGDNAKFLNALGTPDLKRDFYMDVSLIEGGEFVYLDRGFALRVDERNDEPIIYQIVLFSPCPESMYIKNIAIEASPMEEY